MRDETFALHAGFDADPATNAVASPIHRMATYPFDAVANRSDFSQVAR